MKITLAAIFACFVLSTSLTFAADIVPCSGPDCQACHLVQLADNIIKWLIGILTIIGAIMLAVAGLKMVTAGGNPGAVSAAKETLTNIVVGFIIMLSAWLIVDTFMKMFVDESKVGPWNRIECVADLPALGDPQSQPQDPPAGGDPGTTTPSACLIPALTPLSDPLAIQMEGGQTVIWNNPTLQACVSKFRGLVGGTVTSAYRPPQYQTHLWQVKDRWCTKDLRSNTLPECAALKSSIGSDFSRHTLNCSWPVAINSNHSNGTAVDISGIAHGTPTVLSAATASCLTWFGSGDPVHYTLKSGCACN